MRSSVCSDVSADTSGGDVRELQPSELLQRRERQQVGQCREGSAATEVERLQRCERRQVGQRREGAAAKEVERLDARATRQPRRERGAAVPRKIDHGGVERPAIGGFPQLGIIRLEAIRLPRLEVWNAIQALHLEV